MTTPEEQYEYRLDSLRAALSRAWNEGYRASRRDVYYAPQVSHTPDPYAKEES